MDEFLDGTLSLRVTYNENPAPEMTIKSPSGKIIKATSVDDKLKIVNLYVETPEVSTIPLFCYIVFWVILMI